MILKMSGPLRIEDLRHHSAETIDRLRRLLEAGTHASSDPHRKGFYDLEDGDRAFYIHLTPNGAVLLLATWPRQGASVAHLREQPHPEAVACCG